MTGVDPNDLTIVGRLGGTATQPVRTSEMIWDFNELVSYVSRYMTLNPLADHDHRLGFVVEGIGVRVGEHRFTRTDEPGA